MQELLEFIKLIWDLRIVIIILLLVVFLFMCYGKIIGVIAHSKEVFKKGDKNNE